MTAKLPIHPSFAEAYGDALSGKLKKSPYYDESQCNACPHEHRCCDLIVTCSAVEAFSILEWIRANRNDAETLLAKVADHAKIIHDFAAGYSSYVDDDQRIGAWVDDWFKHERRRCPFYDTEKRECGIYPVRPANCRKAWGSGNCESGGIRTTAERRSSMFARALRVQSANLQVGGQGEAELTWLVTHLNSPEAILHVDDSNRLLLESDPATLSPDVLLYGLGGNRAWVEDPFEGTRTVQEPVISLATATPPIEQQNTPELEPDGIIL